MNKQTSCISVMKIPLAEPIRIKNGCYTSFTDEMHLNCTNVFRFERIEDAILRQSDMYFISTVKSRLVHKLFDRSFRLLPILTELGYIY